MFVDKCEHEDGITKNGGLIWLGCQCGGEKCTLGDRFCKDGKCYPEPTCQHTDGRTKNGDNCMCGKNDKCGLFSRYCSNGQCQGEPACEHTDGRTKNGGNCMCGNDKCGLFSRYCENRLCYRKSTTPAPPPPRRAPCESQAHVGIIIYAVGHP